MSKLKLLGGITLLLLVMSSCSLDDSPIGANITPASTDFKVLSEIQVNDKTVNFGIDSVTVSAEFSELVTYTVTFTGLTSGATRSITNTAKKLDLSSLTWYGEHDGVSFFKKDEDVKVEVSFVGTGITSFDTLNISSVNQFNNEFTYNFPAAGFEDIDASNAYGQGWFVGNDEVTLELTRIAVTSPVAIEGEKSFQLSGSVPNSVYVTGIDYGLRGNDEFFDLPANADDVWFNVYVYGNGNPYTELIVEFREADAAGLDEPFRKAKKGEVDGVQAFVNTNHVGWKLFSFQYSTLAFSSFAAGGGSGNKIHESDRIQQMIFNLQTIEGSNGEYSEAIIDYPIFTIGGPFDPTVHFGKP